MDDMMYQAKVAGTGAAITVNCYFKPRYIRIINSEGLCTLEWSYGMGDAAGFKILTGINATTDTPSVMSLISSGGITVDERSFSIGTDSDVNVSGEDLYIQAWR